MAVAGAIAGLSQCLEKLFRDWVVPYDVPGIPEFIERMGEQKIIELIPVIVEQLASKATE